MGHRGDGGSCGASASTRRYSNASSASTWETPLCVMPTSGDCRDFRRSAMSLAGTAISDDGLRFLSHSRELTSLDLREHHHLKHGLSHLSHLDLLKHLVLNGTGVDNSAMSCLAAFSNLRHLSLAETQVTPLGLKDVSRFHLLTLDLDAANVTPQTAADLQMLSNLHGLGLYAADGGDAALACIDGLRHSPAPRRERVHRRRGSPVGKLHSPSKSFAWKIPC